MRRVIMTSEYWIYIIESIDKQADPNPVYVALRAFAQAELARRAHAGRNGGRPAKRKDK